LRVRAQRADEKATALPLAFFMVFSAHSRNAGAVPAGLVGPLADGDPAAGMADRFVCDTAWQATQSDNELLASLHTVRQSIAQGRYYQLNLTTALQAHGNGQAAALFGGLRALQPSQYGFLLDTPDWAVASASPELFFHWHEGHLLTQPMKGTASPSGDPALDRLQLQASAKDRAENVMIVDLLRNDVSRVARPGTVRVSSLFDVQSQPTVVQMTSTVQGQTREGTSLADVFRALFPCGSVTGAPKAETMSHIASLETRPRGVYCGAMGMILPGGSCLFNVAIRTITHQKATGDLSYAVGSGVTWYSDPADELREWQVKAGLAHRVARAFEVLETVRLQDGCWHLLDLHLDRLGRTARHFSYPADLATIRAALERVSAAQPSGCWRGRWLLAAEGAFRVELHPMDALPLPLTVQWATSAMAGDAAYIRHKTTFRPHYDAHRPVAAQASDTLLWDAQGQVLETLRGNLVMQDAQGLWTPPDGLLLPGVMRQHLLQAGTIRQRPMTRDALLRAEALWVVNSLRGWMPVACLVEASGELMARFAVQAA
jgi:para-aminobenzoate synthetase/4-amino-4-deoxychorismate lyase